MLTPVVTYIGRPHTNRIEVMTDRRTLSSDAVVEPLGRQVKRRSR